LEFRLLHVYYSSKRAVNKGVSTPQEERAKRKIEEAAHGTPMCTPRRKRCKSVHRSVPSPWQMRPPRGTPPPYAGPPPGHYTGYSTPHQTPYAGPNGYVHHPLSPPTFAPVREHGHYEEDLRTANFVSPNTIASSSDMNNGANDAAGWDIHHGVQSFGSFDVFDSMEKSSQGEGAARIQPIVGTEMSAVDEVDAYWNDPLISIMMKSSFESIGSDNSDKMTLQDRLKSMHEKVRSRILSKPASEQGAMASLVASWARWIAKSPLEPLPDDMDGKPPPVKNEGTTCL